MGRGSYLGGSTVVHGGSGFFSHSGGPPGRPRKKKDGSDTPGPAKPGSICDFSPLRPISPRKRKQVVEFAVKTAAQKELERQRKESRRLTAEAKELTNRIASSVLVEERRIAQLKRDLAYSQANHLRWIEAKLKADEIDIHGSEVEAAVKLLRRLIETISPQAKKFRSKTRNPAKALKSRAGKPRDRRKSG